MTKNESKQFRLLIIIFWAIIFLSSLNAYYIINHEPTGKRVEISQTLGFFRADLEKISSDKLDKYFSVNDKNARRYLSKEIDDIDELLNCDDRQAVLVYLYSPEGQAKSIDDPAVTTIVIKSDSGWELAKISLTEEKR